MTIFGREPAAISGFVAAVIALAISFGLDWTTEQVGSVMAVVTLGLALLVRQVVTPVKGDGVNPESGQADVWVLLNVVSFVMIVLIFLKVFEVID